MTVSPQDASGPSERADSVEQRASERHDTGVGWPDGAGSGVRAPATGKPPATPPPEPPAGTSGGSPASSPRWTDPPRPPRPRPSYAPLEPERPGNVTAAAVIMFVSAGLAVLLCCGLSLVAQGSRLSPLEQQLLTIASLVLLAGAALNVWLGHYILKGRQWARITTVVLCSVGILGGVIGLVLTTGEAGAGDGLGTCVGIILNIVIIALLSGEAASDYFRSSGR